MSLGGALACNAHGRGLALKPIVEQVESFDLLDPAGVVRTCSRRENPELFRLAIGGYGLFGVITRVQLRLRPRVKVERVVTLGDTGDIGDRFEQRIRDGYLYGDFQFATDDTRDSFLRRGVFSCYRPVDPVDASHRESDQVPPRRLGAADALFAYEQASGLRVLQLALPRDVRPNLLVRLAALRRLRRQLPR